MAVRLPGSSYVRRLHERGLLLPIVVSLVVVGILVQGYLQRSPVPDPEEPADDATSTLPTTSAPFRPDLEKVPLTYFSDYWLQLGERAHDLLVSLGEAQMAGVRVSQGYALSSVAAADAVRVAPGDAPEGQLVAVDGRRGAALFRLTGEVGASPRPSSAALHAGAWIAAVTLDPERGLQVVPGHLVSAPSAAARWLHVAISFPDSFDVAAIVDLDSHLVGVALRRPDGVRVLTVPAATAMVDRLASSPSCRAVDVAPIPDAVRAALHLKEGVVVETVATTAFASPPDLLPGDVLLQLAGEQLSSPEEFAEAWDSQRPGSRVRYLVSRGSRRLVRRIEMPGRDCRPDGESPREIPQLGAVVQWAPGPEAAGPGAGPGFRVLHVPAKSRAAAAGIEPGDVVVAVDGTPLAWPDARRLLDPEWASGHVPVLTVQRGDSVRLTTPPESQEE
ncbi:MAG: hypothetical protein LJF30_25955 [Acidobacteria bacterium]|nr:hypothetical protein [Acidobacteriota bacterium]